MAAESRHTSLRSDSPGTSSSRFFGTQELSSASAPHCLQALAKHEVAAAVGICTKASRRTAAATSRGAPHATPRLGSAEGAPDAPHTAAALDTRPAHAQPRQARQTHGATTHSASTQPRLGSDGDAWTEVRRGSEGLAGKPAARTSDNSEGEARANRHKPQRRHNSRTATSERPANTRHAHTQKRGDDTGSRIGCETRRHRHRSRRHTACERPHATSREKIAIARF